MSGVENQSGGPRGLGSSEGRHRRNAEERWERIYQLRTQDRLGFRTAVYYPTDAVRRARYSAAPFIHSPVPSVARHGGQPPRNSRSRPSLRYRASVRTAADPPNSLQFTNKQRRTRRSHRRRQSSSRFGNRQPANVPYRPHRGRENSLQWEREVGKNGSDRRSVVPVFWATTNLTCGMQAAGVIPNPNSHCPTLATCDNPMPTSSALRPTPSLPERPKHHTAKSIHPISLP